MCREGRHVGVYMYMYTMYVKSVLGHRTHMYVYTCSFGL